MKVFLSLISKILPTTTVYAHCDIPCGIYDPHNMQMAAHTVLRMNQLLIDIKRDDELRAEHDVSRVTSVKDEHAEIVKNEVRILWGDYFKEEHLEKYPDLSQTVFKILKLASKSRQNIDEGTAKELLVLTQRIAEIFFETKGLSPHRVRAPYPTNEDIVLHE